MAKKRSRKRAAPKKHRKYRRNPSKMRRYARAAGGRLLGGLNFKEALKNVLAMNVGMFAAKVAAKRFGIDSTETDPSSWTWRSYLQASVGATLAAMLANMVKKGSRTGQRVLEGGLGYVLFKAVENELIAGHETAEKWFGADDIPEGEMVLDLDGTPGMMMGGQYYPLDEQHRMMGDSIVPVGRLGMGDSIVPVGRLGAAGSPGLDALMRAYNTEYH